jgi:hypothetical protein
MKRLLIVICTVITIFLWGMLGVASAQEKTGPPMGGKDACRADVEKLCKGIRPGEGRIRACLKSNEDRLSQECKNQIAKAKERRQHRQSEQGEPRPE